MTVASLFIYGKGIVCLLSHNSTPSSTPNSPNPTINHIACHAPLQTIPGNNYCTPKTSKTVTTITIQVKC